MTVLQIKYPSSLPALLWLRRNGVDLCKYTVSWLQQPKKHSLCWVCVPTKDFLWILRDKAIAELTLPFCHYNPGSYEALVGFWVFSPLRSTWWVPRLSEKVKQHIKPVPHKRSVLYRVCYCDYFHCKRDSQNMGNIPPCIKTPQERSSVHRSFKTPPRSWATSYGKRGKIHSPHVQTLDKKPTLPSELPQVPDIHTFCRIDTL